MRKSMRRGAGKRSVDRAHRVLVVYPFLPHYRRAVFLALDESDVLDVDFASGLDGSAGVAVMDHTSLRRHHLLRTVRVGPVALQPAVPTIALRGDYDSVVFLGDVSDPTVWVSALLGRFTGKRVYFWTIGWHRPESGFKKHLRLMFYRIAHHLLLYGSVAEDLGKELGYPRHRMHVIGNSVVPPDLGPEPGAVTPPSRAAGTSWVGAVIRLNEVKRLDLLVHAISQLRTEGRDVRVLLVGDGPMRERLERLAAEYGVPLALLPAVYGRYELSRIYDVLDVSVVPAAVGLTAIQSISFGVPVVSDDDVYGQMPEWEAIVPGRTGEIYRKGDPASLARSITRVLDRNAEEPEAVRADCRQEYRSKWSPDAQAERIEKAVLDGAADA